MQDDRMHVTAADNLPEYGEKTTRLDPTEAPPQYSTANPSEPLAKTNQDINADDQWRQSSLAWNEAGEGTTKSRLRGSHKLKRKRWTCPMLLLVLFLCTGIPLIVRRQNRHKRSEFLFDNALPSSSFAITTATFGSTANHPQFFLHFFQLLSGSLQMVFYEKEKHDVWSRSLEVAAEGKEKYKVFTVARDAKLGTGIVHILKEQTDRYMASSLFYVTSGGTLNEIRSSNGPGGWGTVTAGEESWSEGSLGQGSTNGIRVSSHDMELAAGYDPLDTYFDLGNNVCPGIPGGTAWLFFRPAENASLVQEWNWDGATDVWHPGSTFEGIKPGSSLVTLVTPVSPAMRPLPVVRWLYGLGDDGMLHEWFCQNCCVNTTNHWIKSNITYSLPQADLASLALSGRTNSSIRIMYYRGEPGAILKIRSSDVDFHDQENGGLSSSFSANLIEPSQILGTHLDPGNRFACSLTTSDLQENRCIHPWADGQIVTINDTVGGLPQRVPTSEKSDGG